MITITLKYVGKQPVIKGLKRVSKPGLRILSLIHISRRTAACASSRTFCPWRPAPRRSSPSPTCWPRPKPRRCAASTGWRSRAKAPRPSERRRPCPGKTPGFLWLFPRAAPAWGAGFDGDGELKKIWENFEKSLQNRGLYGIIIKRDCTGVPDKGTPDMR